MAFSMLKIRRPLGRLIFNMGIAIPGKTVFLIETAPRQYEYDSSNSSVPGVTQPIKRTNVPKTRIQNDNHKIAIPQNAEDINQCNYLYFKEMAATYFQISKCVKMSAVENSCNIFVT